MKDHCLYFFSLYKEFLCQSCNSEFSC